MSLRLIVLAAAAALLLIAPALPQTPAPAGPTLKTIRARGHLICAGSDPLPGFAQVDAKGIWTGFDVDFCRAVAAAIFGDPSKLEFRALSGDARFAELQTGDIDLVARDADWTMRRDTRYGVSYVASIFYDGQGFMVPTSRNIVSAYQLDNLRLCVLDQRDHRAPQRGRGADHPGLRRVGCSAGQQDAGVGGMGPCAANDGLLTAVIYHRRKS